MLMVGSFTATGIVSAQGPPGGGSGEGEVPGNWQGLEMGAYKLKGEKLLYAETTYHPQHLSGVEVYWTPLPHNTPMKQIWDKGKIKVGTRRSYRPDYLTGKYYFKTTLHKEHITDMEMTNREGFLSGWIVQVEYSQAVDLSPGSSFGDKYFVPDVTSSPEDERELDSGWPNGLYFLLAWDGEEDRPMWDGPPLANPINSLIRGDLLSFREDFEAVQFDYKVAISEGNLDEMVEGLWEIAKALMIFH